MKNRTAFNQLANSFALAAFIIRDVLADGEGRTGPGAFYGEGEEFAFMRKKVTAPVITMRGSKTGGSVKDRKA